jgi:hypothetical protein
MTNTLSSVSSTGQFTDTNVATTNLPHQGSDGETPTQASTDLRALIKSTLADQPPPVNNDNTPPAISRQRRNATHDNAATTLPSQPQVAATARPNDQVNPDALDPDEADPDNVPILISLVKATPPFQNILNQWKNEGSHAEERMLITNYDKTQTPSAAVINAVVKGIRAIVTGWRTEGTFSDRVQQSIEYGKNRLTLYLAHSKVDPAFKPNPQIQAAQEMGLAGMEKLWHKSFMGDWENTEEPNMILYTYEIIERTSTKKGTAFATV